MPRLNLQSFSLEAPETWTLSTLILAGPVEQDPTAASMLTTKAVSPFQQNVIATMEQVGPEETAESYVKKQLEGLRRAKVRRQDAAAPETITTSGGTTGLLTHQVVEGPGGERVRQMQLVAIKNGVAHTVIASHLEGKAFERAEPTFRKMLQSFV